MTHPAQEQAIDALIARLEKATVPDRELDRAIGRAVGVEIVSDYANGLNRVIKDIPHYTASIDAALTLVPEGMDWDVNNMTGNGDYRSYVMYLSAPGEWTSRSGKAINPAIALCIAALKARKP